MNSGVQEQPGRQPLPDVPAEQASLAIVLTTHTRLQGRQDITASLRRERFDLRLVTACNRLPEAVDRTPADIVLVDMDAADLAGAGAQHMSGHRLVTLLARQLAHRNVALVVMTSLDFVEVEDLARAGVHALISPKVGTKGLVEQLHLALRVARRRYEYDGRGQAPTPLATVGSSGQLAVSWKKYLPPVTTAR